MRYVSATDAEALRAFEQCCRSEGIIPALESSHALALIAREGAALGAGGPVLVCLSGRGDKDVDTAARWFGLIDGADLVAAEELKAAEPVADAEGSGW